MWFILQIALGVCLGLWLFRFLLRHPLNWRWFGLVALLVLYLAGLMWAYVSGYTTLALFGAVALFVVGEFMDGRFDRPPSTTAGTDAHAPRGY